MVVVGVVVVALSAMELREETARPFLSDESTLSVRSRSRSWSREGEMETVAPGFEFGPLERLSTKKFAEAVTPSPVSPLLKSGFHRKAFAAAFSCGCLDAG